MLFKEEAAGSVLQPAVLTLRIQPHEGISLRFVAKVPGEHINVGNVLMTMTYADAFKRPIAEAYERLLLDCMRGDATLFNRRDSVDRAWELIQPVLQVWEATPGVHYLRGRQRRPAGRRRDDGPRRPQLARARSGTLSIRARTATPSSATECRRVLR